MGTYFRLIRFEEKKFKKEALWFFILPPNFTICCLLSLIMSHRFSDAFCMHTNPKQKHTCVSIYIDWGICNAFKISFHHHLVIEQPSEQMSTFPFPQKISDSSLLRLLDMYQKNKQNVTDLQSVSQNVSVFGSDDEIQCAIHSKHHLSSLLIHARICPTFPKVHEEFRCIPDKGNYFSLYFLLYFSILLRKVLTQSFGLSGH